MFVDSIKLKLANIARQTLLLLLQLDHKFIVND